jgi:hypothetical protein
MSAKPLPPTKKKLSRTITIDVQGGALKDADKRLDELVYHLRASGSMKLANKDQLAAKLSAAQRYLQVPRAKRNFLDELLVRPLKRIVKDKPSALATARASELLTWFRQL